jgi:hypothetical protein
MSNEKPIPPNSWEIPPLPGSDRRVNENSGIAMEERSLLKDVAENPLSVVTDRYERLGLGVHKGNNTKLKLIEKNLIEEERISVPEGIVTLLKPTEKGRELLASWGMMLKVFPHNGSLAHQYTKKRIAEEYRSKGYHVEEEYTLGGGKAMDPVARRGDEMIAIEVETTSNYEGNVSKYKDAGFGKVIVERVS